MTAPKFTPLPWMIDDRPLYAYGSGIDAAPTQRGNVVADCPTAFGGHCIVAPATVGQPCRTKEAMDAEGLANADFIVRACNAHDALVRALRSLSALCKLDEVDSDLFERAVADADAALAEAERRDHSRANLESTR